MTIYPFIFLKNKAISEDKVVIYHERIHLRQQLEMLWIVFFVWYGIEFLVRFIQYQDADKAYRNISFERESYTNEMNFNYLENRRFWYFIKYL